MTDHPVKEQVALRVAVERLVATFTPHYSAEEIHEIVEEIHRDFDDAKVREFVPLLTERRARRRLGGQQ